jgi:putative membrane-bound dehydrogenase-like protein
MTQRRFFRRGLCGLLVVVLAGVAGGVSVLEAEDAPGLRVGAAAVNFQANDKMEIAGSLEPHYATGQEGELRAVAVVVGLGPIERVAIVGCDVLFLPRDLLDPAVREIEQTTGIPASHILVNATHTHHAPSTVPAHAFGASEEFRQVVKKGIVKAVQEADRKLADGDCRFYFHLGEETTVGANSRLQLEDGNITWINPMREAAGKGQPTGPFDPQLPVLDFRDAKGKSRAIIFNHSTHTIGTRSGRDVRSSGFYGLTAQELEQELGGTVCFLEGASGSTHNITQVPVPEAIARLKKAVLDARKAAEPRNVTRLAALRRPFKFRVRRFDDAEEDQKVLRYTSRHAAAASDRIRQIFADSRDKLRPHQGEERETRVQVILIGDVAIVGVPAEYFTSLGVDIKKRSPFRNTYIAELANDWIGYLPDRDGHQRGGYQAWLGLHSYAEVGTGERIADEAVAMLNELAGKSKNDAPEGGGGKPKPDASGPAAQSPASEKTSFRLSDTELNIELCAAEPDIISPVAMAWDASGRLFVAEMIGYPETEGLCRIALLEDTDGDGRYERKATFADRLNFVNSVMPFRNGIFATAAPDLLYLEDTDGDGQADIRRVEWTGFATGSQQLRANALHWGLDNWIYGANGRVGGDVRRPEAPAESAVSLRTRDFRFDPIHGRFESLVGQSQFGQSHDDWGNRFLSWNTIPLRHVLLDDAESGGSLHSSAEAVVNIADPSDTGRVYPVSPPPRQFNGEQATYYNATCGLAVYRGEALGPQYAGNAFFCESLTNLITRRVLIAEGPTFVARRAETETDREFLASTDSWFHPVFLTTGPDGALYVVDFYREFVEHPIYVADRRARAETDWRRGADHGRLWRITRKEKATAAAGGKADALPARTPRLQKLPAAELAPLLAHPVGWWRDTAQRLLIERQDKTAAPLLRTLLKESDSPRARSHALWTLRGLDELTESDLITGLSDADGQVRRQALRAVSAPLAMAAGVRGKLAALADDADPRVRFQAALSLELTDAGLAAPVLADLIERDHDRWTRLAVLCSASAHPWPLLESLLARESWRNGTAPWKGSLLEDLAEQLAARREEQLGPCLDWLAAHGTSSPAPALFALAGGLARGAESHGTTLERAAAKPGSPWNVIAPRLPALGGLSVGAATNVALPIEVRRAATEILGHVATVSGDDTVIKLLDPAEPQVVQSAATRALANRNAPELCRRAFDRWQSLTAATRLDVLAATLRSPAAAAALLDALSGETVQPGEIPAYLREAFVRHRDPALRERAGQLLAGSASADRQAVVTRYETAVPLHGDVARGAELFRQHCLACHAVQGVGPRVGPDLAAVGSRNRNLLLIDILDPSRNVTPDFAAYVAVTRQGRVFSGIIAAETAEAVTIRRERGEQDTLLRSEVEELRATGKSIMPEGLEEKLTPAQLADVLEFLREPNGKLLGSPAAEAGGAK